MKKKIATILFITLISLNTGLYSQSHQKGDFNLNLGVGLGNSWVGSGSTRSLPLLNVSGEIGITDEFSLGGYLGFTGNTYEYSGYDNCNNYGNGKYYYNYVDTYKYTYFIAGFRTAYHFGKLIKIDKLDVYVGSMLGYNFANYSYSSSSNCNEHIRYNSPTYGGFAYSIYGAARYRFTEHFGVFAELGYGVSILNTGLNFKF